MPVPQHTHSAPTIDLQTEAGDDSNPDSQTLRSAQQSFEQRSKEKEDLEKNTNDVALDWAENQVEAKENEEEDEGEGEDALDEEARE